MKDSRPVRQPHLASIWALDWKTLKCGNCLNLKPFKDNLGGRCLCPNSEHFTQAVMNETEGCNKLLVPQDEVCGNCHYWQPHNLTFGSGVCRAQGTCPVTEIDFHCASFFLKS